MPADRFFIDAPLKEGETVTLEGAEFRHLAVMRAQVGERVELVNGKGAFGEARILQFTKHRASLAVQNVFTEKKPTQELILAQALPRAPRLDFIIEKGTELGMTSLYLFPGEKGERKDANPERLQTLAISAMKQCGRLYLPEILLKPPLAEWETVEGPAFFGDLDSAAPPLLKALPANTSRLLFFVGPESGFTEGETRKMKALGAKGVSLHRNILRTETAAIVALTLMSAGSSSGAGC